MRKFIDSSLSFLIAILVIAVFCELLLRSIPNDFKKKQHNLEEYKEYIEVLVLGNSHNYYGINPEYFSRPAFNMAYISQTYDLDLAILNQHIEKLNSLKYVIISYSYFSLFEILSKDPNEAWRMKNYNLYYDFNSSLFSKYNSELLSQSEPFHIIYNHFVKSESFITSTGLGWGMNYNNSGPEGMDISAKRISKKHSKIDFSLMERNLGTLDTLFDLSEKHKFKLIFISTPCHPLYNANLQSKQKEINVTTMEKILNDCSNCSYLDFSSDSTFVDSHFYDADHLNSKGAIKLSKALNAYLKSIKNP